MGKQRQDRSSIIGRRVTSVVGSVVLASALLAGAAQAKVTLVSPPTLHAFCNASAPCTDNGTHTPTSVNPPNFGFSAGGHSATGDVTLYILAPDTAVAHPSSLTYTVSGPLIGSAHDTAGLFSSTPWTSGKLDSYLGISASPTNPIGAYLPATQTYQPSANGFYVYGVDIGTVTLPSNSGANNSFLLTLSSKLFQGSYVTAFIDEGGKYGATANSGALLEVGQGVPEPATWALMLSGFAALGYAGYRRKRSAFVTA